MNEFIYDQQPARVIFGRPFLDAILQELATDSITSAWIIASHRCDSLVQGVIDLPGISVLEHFSRVLPHVPEDQVQKARHAVAKSKPDIIIAIGGGSAIGLAKAVALKHPLPIWAVPTTYSGSEMTNIYGITSAGKKQVGRDTRAVPEKVIYDPELSSTQPLDFAAKSALNALAHLVEATYSKYVNPFTYCHAIEGLQLVFGGLAELAEKQSLTKEINKKLLLGASFAGKSLSETEMALHHKSAHILGGSYGLDHASVHAVLLPFILNYQWQFLSGEIQREFKSIFNSDTPSLTLLELIKRLGLPATLKAIGFSQNHVPNASKEISALDFKNPAPVTQKSTQRLLESALTGQFTRNR